MSGSGMFAKIVRERRPLTMMKKKSKIRGRADTQDNCVWTRNPRTGLQVSLKHAPKNCRVWRELVPSSNLDAGFVRN